MSNIEYMVHHDTGCIGCRICEIVCSLSLYGKIVPQKSAIAITLKDSLEYTIVVCNQCGECIAHCPEHALYWDKTTVKIDSVHCTACYICVEVCPTNAIFANPEEKEPIKCIQCGVCVTACPANVLL